MDAVPDFGKEYIVEPGNSSDKSFHAISKFAGGTELAQWVHEKLWRTQRLLPPKKYTELCQRHFDWLDADSTSLAIDSDALLLEQDADDEDDDIDAGWPPHCEVEVFLSPEDDDDESAVWSELRGRPAGGEWVYYQTHFVAVGKGEHEGKILVLDENVMKAEWFEADRVRVKLSTPAEMTSRQPKTPKTKGTRASKSPASSPDSAQKQIGPVCPRGLLREKVYCRIRDAPWFCVVVYARLSEDAQDLDKFLCDLFLEKIKDAALRDACQRQSGGRFTEAYMAWVVLAGANPGAQVIDGLNETKLTYQSVDHLAALMPKRKEAVLSTTTDQRLCWEALRVLTKGIETEKDSETKQALARLRVTSLSTSQKTRRAAQRCMMLCKWDSRNSSSQGQHWPQFSGRTTRCDSRKCTAWRRRGR